MASFDSSAAYAYKPGGTLKFKGGSSSTDKTKKRKKKSSSSSTASHDLRRAGEGSGGPSEREREREKALLQMERHREDGTTPGESKILDEREGIDEAGGRDMDEEEEIAPTSRMTEAERKFDMVRKKRMADRVAKQAKLSHKDRVDAFNRDLESRTEHFEMKRVGGGG